jgi:hypothetical protein
MKKEEQQFSDNDLNDQLPSLGKDMGGLDTGYAPIRSSIVGLIS